MKKFGNFVDFFLGSYQVKFVILLILHTCIFKKKCIASKVD